MPLELRHLGKWHCLNFPFPSMQATCGPCQLCSLLLVGGQTRSRFLGLQGAEAQILLNEFDMYPNMSKPQCRQCHLWDQEYWLTACLGIVTFYGFHPLSWRPLLPSFTVGELAEYRNRGRAHFVGCQESSRCHSGSERQTWLQVTKLSFKTGPGTQRQT